ncbi:cold shock domain-containing protein [uncultured Chitinophaga sp.]|jgi:Cold shock proteins|uniref:cold shock domain-containing protein n=1 Tax=uncultured Chitinophaga sp. TaxID=339340 RepID=UPI0026206F42|nr:cold shock domain-containing protein [uncultured Chitinophaga sp.]
MARPNESSNKQENEKKKRQHKQEKQEKKEARKASKHSTSFEDMLAYVDENGNITSTPPDPSKKREISLEEIQLGVPRQETIAAPADGLRRGVVKFFNESKGYGFIIDQHTQESVFVHIRQLQEPIKERDKVVFEIEQGHKGPSAVNVKKG